jgi:ABC-type nitrate/sulfonate/bicarbonate transport system substrate-binding protein
VGTRRIRLGAFYRSLPMMAAEQRGFYKELGLEVEFHQVKSSTQQFQSLNDDEYDVVQTSPDNTANYRYNEGNPIGQRVDSQAFMGMDHGMYLVVVVRPEIEKIADLAGQTVSVDAPESGFAYVLYKILAGHGLRRGEDYSVVSTGGVFDRYMAMVEQDADFAGTLMSGGFETRAARRGFKLLDSVRDIADPYLGVWAAAKRTWLADNRDAAVGFVTGYRRATDWVFDPANREDCLDMLSAIPNTPRDLADELYEVQLRPGVGNIPDSGIEPAAVRNVLSLRQEFGGFERAQDVDALVGPDTELFDLSYLQESATGG